MLVSYSFCSVSAIPFVVNDKNFSECYNNYAMYIHVLGLVFDVFGGFITPAIRRTMRCEIWAQPAELPLVERSV